MIIVTGGAGFIGSALVCALNAKGMDDVMIVDRLDTSEKWKNLVNLRFKDYIDADDFLTIVSQRTPLLSGVKAIYHLGACSSTTETDAAFLMRNNFEYTKTLAAYSVAAGIRFIYASSAATYGALESDLRDDADLDSLRPLNMYAYSKHRFDVYARDHGWLDHITGLKYFNIFGPNEQHKGNMRSLVDKAFTQISQHGTVELFKSYRPEFRDGEQQRDFLYVKDAVRMTLHLGAGPFVGLYNIGAGRPHTWLDLVRPIFAALGKPARISFINMPEGLRDKYQYRTTASMERFHRTNYNLPIIPLEDAVTDYVLNYLVPGAKLEKEFINTVRGPKSVPG